MKYHCEDLGKKIVAAVERGVSRSEAFRLFDMENLIAHKGERVCEIIDVRGCGLLYLPPYSPDFNLIEGASSKIKGLARKAEARTREMLLEATGSALLELSASYVMTSRVSQADDEAYRANHGNQHASENRR